MNHSAKFDFMDLPKFYQNLMSRADPRVENFPLMSTPIKLWIIMLIYLWIVRQGPKWMESKKPWQMRGVMVAYNFFLVVLSSYMVYEFCAAGWLTGYTLGCVPVDYSNSPKSVRMVRVSWLFFISKVIELFDTIIFILRKKNNQITFLHLFHHVSMPVCTWWGIKFVAGGMGSLMGLVNSLVHVIMYAYYCLSAIGPRAQKFLFWKRYLTRIQLIQFFLLLAHMSQLYFIDCDYPMIFCVAISVYACMFTALFLNFYYKEYLARNLHIKHAGIATVSQSRDQVKKINNVISNDKQHLNDNGFISSSRKNLKTD